jgi:hypothetical protein
VSFENFSTSSYASEYALGYSLGVRQMLHYTGINQQKGIYNFQDYDHDGQISYPNDYKQFVDVRYKYFGGVDNKISYMGFNLDFLVQFVNKNAPNYYSTLRMPGTLNSNEPLSALTRWKTSNENSPFEMYSQNNGSLAGVAYSDLKQSNFIISNASFVRLRNVSLSYNLPKRMIKGFQNLKIYIEGQNLITITKYLGSDPETQSLTSLPPSRVFAAGIQINL